MDKLNEICDLDVIYSDIEIIEVENIVENEEQENIVEGII